MDGLEDTVLYWHKMNPWSTEDTVLYAHKMNPCSGEDIALYGHKMELWSGEGRESPLDAKRHIHVVSADTVWWLLREAFVQLWKFFDWNDDDLMFCRTVCCL